MKAAINLLSANSISQWITKRVSLERVEANVVEAAVIIELPDLKGRAQLGDTPLFVLIQKEGL